MIFNKPAQCKHCGEAIIKGTGTDECWIDRGLSRFCGFSGQQHEPAEPAAAPPKMHISQIPGNLLNDGITEVVAPADSTPQKCSIKTDQFGYHCICSNYHGHNGVCRYHNEQFHKANSTRPEPLSAECESETSTAGFEALAKNMNAKLQVSPDATESMRAALQEIKSMAEWHGRTYSQGFRQIAELAMNVLTSPAAPRTQGSEPEVDELQNQLLEVGQALGNVLVKVGVLGGDLQLTGPELLLAAETYLAAQPQPAPRPPVCPKCGDGDIALQIMQFGQLTCGKCKFHFMIKQPIDFAQFFTAIPAQNCHLHSKATMVLP